MKLSFSDLWEECEKFYSSHKEEDSIEEILNKIQLKILLYKSISNNDKFSKEEKEKIISHTFGEILFELCKISYIQNINVFTALQNNLNFKIVSYFENK